MADQPSIFSNTDQPATQPTPVTNVQPQSNAVEDLLALVKNERGEPKYKDINDAFNGLKHAQEYIPTLKNELSQKDQELAAAKAELERLKEVERSVFEYRNQQDQRNNPPVAPALDETKIAELVQRTITTREAQQTAQANLGQVVSTLQSVFGADAERTFYSKASEVGLTVEQMNSLAASSPKAVLKMLGIEGTQKQNVSPVPGTINTSAFAPKQDSFVGRNPKSAMIGATTADLYEATKRAKGMVDELHAQGLSVHDLSDPKTYAKYFGKQ